MKEIDITTYVPLSTMRGTGRESPIGYNHADISLKILEKIEENVDKYIKNKGVPLCNRGTLSGDFKDFLERPQIKFDLIFGTYEEKENIKKILIHNYSPGRFDIEDLMKFFSLGEVIIDFHRNGKHKLEEIEEMKRKGGLKNRWFLFRSGNLIRSLIQNSYDNSLSGLIYNLIIQETQDEDFNINMQPSLRNYLTIRDYFKIVEFEHQDNVNLEIDFRYREILEKVPIDLRTRKF